MKRILGIVFLLIIATSCARRQETIGISKIVAHPALDAVEQGIQDELKSRGRNFAYDLQNANGDIATASTLSVKPFNIIDSPTTNSSLSNVIAI